MTKIIDNLIALRIVFLLTLPFNKWPAYKQGFIDEKGNFLRPDDAKESSDWTMLHRLVCRLKLLLAKIPGGSSTSASFIASYLLVRECLESGDDGSLLVEDDILGKEISFKDYRDVRRLQEEISLTTNSVTNVAGVKPGDEAPGPDVVLGSVRRRQREKRSKNAKNLDSD